MQKKNKNKTLQHLHFQSLSSELQVATCNIEGILIIKLKSFIDHRGSFTETYNKSKYKEIGINYDFVQDNMSISKKNVIRGLHFQLPPFAQGKLIRVLKGHILDVIVDLRKNSPTYGKYFSIELSEEDNLQIWIPEGFAHGFASLSKTSIFTYKCTNFYNPLYERIIRWDDETLKIDWKVKNPILSEKDLKNAINFKDFVSSF